jgi:S1-C subfamily serine protease
MPGRGPNPGSKPDEALPELGLSVERLPDARAKELGLEAGQGVVVKMVAPTSLGAQLGIRTGDVVTHVNEQVVVGVDGFAALVAGGGRGERLSFAMRRGKMLIFKTIQR